MKSWLLPLAAYAALLVGPSAGADDQALHAQAKALVDAGSSAYSAHDYVQALAQFRQAYQVFPDPKILYNIGRAALQTGDTPLAATAFHGFLRGTLPAETIAAQRKFAQEKLDSLTSTVGALHVAISPAASVVTVDGEKVPVAADLAAGPDSATGDQYFAPGDHQVVAVSPGHQTWSQTVSVRAAENQNVVIRLESATAAVTPPVNLTPAVTAIPPPTPSPATAAQAQVEPAPQGHSPWPWVVIGVGGASLVASAITGVMANSNNSTLGTWVSGVSSPPTPTQLSQTRSNITTDAWISTATLGAGVIAAGVGIVMLIHDRSATTAETGNRESSP